MPNMTKAEMDEIEDARRAVKSKATENSTLIDALKALEQAAAGGQETVLEVQAVLKAWRDKDVQAGIERKQGEALGSMFKVVD